MIPSGICVEYLPAYSPELQPAERLWSVTDEPLVNKSFDKIQDLETVLEERCQILSTTMTEPIKNLTNYYWWPQIVCPLNDNLSLGDEFISIIINERSPCEGEYIQLFTNRSSR